MSPPAQENWVLAEFGKIEKRLENIERKVDGITAMGSGQGTRIAVLETKERGAIGGLKWIGAILAGGVGSAITLLSSWIMKS